MPKYLIEASYTLDGVKGVMKEGGSKRREAVDAAVKGVGGRVESFYFGFGNSDVYIIVDLPDNISAAAMSMAVNQTGAVQLRTVVLMSAEEIDAAAKKTIAYRAPGR